MDGTLTIRWIVSAAGTASRPVPTPITGGGFDDGSAENFAHIRRRPSSSTPRCVMRRFRLLTVFAIGLASSSCGSSGTSTFDPNLNGSLTNGTFKATIHGAAWSPIGTVIVSRVGGGLPMAATSTTYAMSVVVLNVSGPGTFTLNASVHNGSHIAVSSAGQSGWGTGNTGGTGTVVITTLTANHVTGTFSCDAPPNGTSTAAALHVTSGTFDLSFCTSLGWRNSERRCGAPERGTIKLELGNSERRCEAPERGTISEERSGRRRGAFRRGNFVLEQLWCVELGV